MHVIRPTHIGAIALAITLGGAWPALGAQSEIVPGITYERLVQGAQVTHITRVNPGPLVSVRPERITGEVDTRGLLTGAMGARAKGGALLGVNGDYFNWENGYPSGMLVLGGELVHEPEATRSALAFLGDGRLTSVKSALAGEWNSQDPATGAWSSIDPITSAPKPLGFIGVNRPAERDETILYTSRFGDPTPAGNRADAVIAIDGGGLVTPNREMTGTVAALTSGGGASAGPGTVVLSGIGAAPRARVEAFLKPGFRVRVKPTLPNLPDGLNDAIGGGPLLVQEGRAVHDADEGFSFGQVGTRAARTAVGQTAAGQVLMVVSEGPLEGSPGMTVSQQADQLAALGAQTAVAMDSGGSSALALRNRIVNRVAAGERRISNAVIVRYAGVQLTDPATLISPNGDGVAESTGAYARAAKDGQVNISLNRANGKAVKLLYRGRLGPSARALRLSGRTIRVPDGGYKIVAKFTPADGSLRSTNTRQFVVDRTLAGLSLKKVGKGAKAKLRIGYRLTHAARVTVVVRDAGGNPVKQLMSRRRLPGGARAALWDMKVDGKPLAAGLYSVAVTTRADGANTLGKRFRMLEVKPAK